MDDCQALHGGFCVHTHVHIRLTAKEVTGVSQCIGFQLLFAEQNHDSGWATVHCARQIIRSIVVKRSNSLII